MIYKCELPPVAVSKMPNKFMSTKKKIKKSLYDRNVHYT